MDNTTDADSSRFKWRTRGRTVLYWLPVVILMGVLIYCYYAYVVTFCILFLIYGEPSHKTRAALYLAFFHILLLMFSWTFWATILTDAGRPSDIPNLAVDEPKAFGQEDPQPVERDGTILLPNSYARFCPTCKYAKPDRCHHCSMCKRCVLKMDHHCVWLNNCVGQLNYKHFLLTLVYGNLMGAFMGITLFQQLVYNAANDLLELNDIQLLIALVLSFTFSTAAFALLAYHIYLVLHNKTTIEALEEKERVDVERRIKTFRIRERRDASPRPDPKFNPYDLESKRRNVRAAIGSTWWLWPVPLHDKTISSGVWFPRCHDAADDLPV